MRRYWTGVAITVVGAALALFGASQGFGKAWGVVTIGIVCVGGLVEASVFFSEWQKFKRLP